MNRKTWWAVLFTLGVRPALAADVFEHPLEAHALAALIEPSVQREVLLRGNYTQRKTLNQLPRPLVSKGDFLFVRERGVLWRTRSPDPLELVINPAGLFRREKDTVQELSRVASPMFLALFTLDFDALERDFELFGLSRSGRWQLGLRPRAGALAAAVETIRMQGRAHVQKIELKQAHEITEIRFSGLRAYPAPSTDEITHLQTRAD